MNNVTFEVQLNRNDFESKSGKYSIYLRITINAN